MPRADGGETAVQDTEGHLDGATRTRGAAHACRGRPASSDVADLPFDGFADVATPEIRRRGDPLRIPVLVVNRYFQPVQVTNARRAFLLLFGGAALAIDDLGEASTIFPRGERCRSDRKTMPSQLSAGRCVYRACCTLGGTSECGAPSSGSRART